MRFSNCFLCYYQLSERAKFCPKCGEPDPHNVDFLIKKIKRILNQCACPRYSDGLMESYDDADQIKVFYTVCEALLMETLNEISEFRPSKLYEFAANFLPSTLIFQGYKPLHRTVFEHNSIVIALADHLFSPLPNIESVVQTRKLNYLLRSAFKPPFYLIGVESIEGIKRHRLLDDAVRNL